MSQVPYRGTVEMNVKLHISELTKAGDYCFDSTGKVIMACPKCATVFYCLHTVEQRSPLTLSPSVVGPSLEGYLKEGETAIRAQVLAPCLHHFWVRDGKAVEIV